MLADRLGSDTGVFPLAGVDGARDGAERFAWSLPRARDLLRARGLAPDQARVAAGLLPWSASALTGYPVARPGQAAMMKMALPPPGGRICLIEDETGAGKTEAALIHFLALFGAGVVDGLYFALPTRAAARQIFQRIEVFLHRVRAR